MAILLLLASNFLLCSSAEFWTEWFNPKKSEVPPNELLEFETLFRELDEANPFMEELVEGVLAVPASPVHPIFQVNLKYLFLKINQLIKNFLHY